MIAVGAGEFPRSSSPARMPWTSTSAPRRCSKNIPVVMGLIGYWHRVVCGYPARAVIPYDQRLSRFPAYLQQLDMESNGKQVTIDGSAVATPTGPLVWGEPGTNGQHAFFQLLHQGTDVIPVEFLAAAEGHEPDFRHHHDLLLANCLAQSRRADEGPHAGGGARADAGQGHWPPTRSTTSRRTGSSPATGPPSPSSTGSSIPIRSAG